MKGAVVIPLVRFFRNSCPGSKIFHSLLLWFRRYFILSLCVDKQFFIVTHFFTMKHSLLLFAMILITSITCAAQSVLKLTHKTRGKEIAISPGDRVAFVIENTTKTEVGILGKVTTDSIWVEGQSHALNSLSRFGVRAKGSGFGSVAFGALGGSFLGAAIAPEPEVQCSGCNRITTEDDSYAVGKAVFGVLGVGFASWGIAIGIKNSARDLRKWQLAVVEINEGSE